MILKNMHNFKKFFLLLIIIGTISCEDNIREVTIFEKGSIEITPSTLTVPYGGTIDFASNAVKTQSIKWTFEGGDPATSFDENVTVKYSAGTGEFENTYQVKLEVKYIDNQTETKTITIVVAADPDYTPPITGGGGGPLGPQNIAFVSNNVGADQGYIDLLEAAGHKVTSGNQWANLDAAKAADLNTYDLVIISRSTNSAEFGDAARPFWTTVTTPTLNMSAFVTRNNRLQNFNSDAFFEGAPSSISVVDTAHPVFTGIDITSGSTGDITASPLHVAGIANPGNGTLIGRTPDGIYGAIAFWDANTASYAGADVFAAKRMFLTASGGGFTLNDIGSKLFLNCVEYIISGTVFGGPIDGLGFYTERETTESIEAERPPANSGNFNLSYVTDAAEGSEAIYGNYATTGTGNDVTWGAMISMYPSDGTNRVTLDVSAYNYYNISLKAPAENTSPIRLRFRTGGGNYWVTLNDEYGFVRDGQWHNLKIPLSDLKFDGAGAALDTDKASITEVIFRSDADVNGISANFDWYIDDIYFTVD